MSPRIWTAVFLLFSLLQLSAQTAQRKAPTTGHLGKLTAINITGLEHFKEQDVIASVPLDVGQSVTDDEFKKAARNLADLGIFSDVAYRFATLPGSVQLQLEVIENKNLLPAIFDNFIWWKDSDLKARVHQRVPLFQGLVPARGSLSDLVGDALQGLISEKQIPGHVEYMRQGPENGPPEKVFYRLEGSPMRIHAVEFPGAPKELTESLDEAVQKDLLGRDYSSARVQEVAARSLKDIYLQHGYLQVQFGDPNATVEADTSDPALVDLQLPVTPGRQYVLGKIEWTGNRVFTAAQLQKLIHGEPGKPIDGLQLRRDFEDVRAVYGTRGYLKAIPRVSAQTDAASGEASYLVQVTEGPVYRFTEVTFDNVDDHLSAKLREAWALRSGEPYDASYPYRFMRETESIVPTGLRSRVEVNLSPNDSDKTVEVTLRYGVAPEPRAP